MANGAGLRILSLVVLGFESQPSHQSFKKVVVSPLSGGGLFSVLVIVATALAVLAMFMIVIMMVMMFMIMMIMVMTATFTILIVFMMIVVVTSACAILIVVVVMMFVIMVIMVMTAALAVLIMFMMVLVIMVMMFMVMVVTSAVAMLPMIMVMLMRRRLILDMEVHTRVLDRMHHDMFQLMPVHISDGGHEVELDLLLGHHRIVMQHTLVDIREVEIDAFVTAGYGHLDVSEEHSGFLLHPSAYLHYHVGKPALHIGVESVDGP